eukprot:gb/GECG01007170.1/.p1 GENE.gb/GECG01007170.1/~~gb/GECG01007170.1/.p1  ORF type:complete len:1884 (+),score=217.53 gb/GECG01007170.1/:1-5652(+)
MSSSSTDVLTSTAQDDLMTMNGTNGGTATTGAAAVETSGNGIRVSAIGVGSRIPEVENEDEDLLGINTPPANISTAVRTAGNGGSADERAVQRSARDKSLTRLSPLRTALSNADDSREYFTALESGESGGSMLDSNRTASQPLSVPARGNQNQHVFFEPNGNQVGLQNQESAPADSEGIGLNRRGHSRTERSLSGTLDLQSTHLRSTITAKEMFLSDHPPARSNDGHVAYPMFSTGIHPLEEDSSVPQRKSSSPSTVSTSADNIKQVNLEDGSQNWGDWANYKGSTIPQNQYAKQRSQWKRFHRSSRADMQKKSAGTPTGGLSSPLGRHQMKFSQFRKVPSLQMLLRTRSLQRNLTMRHADQTTQGTYSSGSYFDSGKNSVSSFRNFQLENVDAEENDPNQTTVETLSQCFPEIKALEQYSCVLESYLQSYSVYRHIWTWTWTVHFSKAFPGPPMPWFPIKLLYYCKDETLDQLCRLCRFVHEEEEEVSGDRTLLYGASTLGKYEVLSGRPKAETRGVLERIVGVLAEIDNFLEESSSQETEPYFAFVPLSAPIPAALDFLAAAAFQAFEYSFTGAEPLPQPRHTEDAFLLVDFVGNSFLSLEAVSRGLVELLATRLVNKFMECAHCASETLNGDPSQETSFQDDLSSLFESMWDNTEGESPDRPLLYRRAGRATQEHAEDRSGYQSEGDVPRESPRPLKTVRHKRNKSGTPPLDVQPTQTPAFWSPRKRRQDAALHLRREKMTHGLRISKSPADHRLSTLNRLWEWVHLGVTVHPHILGNSNAESLQELASRLIPEADVGHQFPATLADIDLGGATAPDKVCLFRGWLYKATGKPDAQAVWESILAQKDESMNYEWYSHLNEQQLENLDAVLTEARETIQADGSTAFLSCESDHCERVRNILRRKGVPEQVLPILTPLVFGHAPPPLRNCCESSSFGGGKGFSSRDTAPTQFAIRETKTAGGVTWKRCYCILQADSSQIASQLLSRIHSDAKETPFTSPKNLANFMRDSAIYESKLVYGDTPEEIYSGKFSTLDLTPRSIEAGPVDFSFNRIVSPLVRERKRRNSAAETAKGMKDALGSLLSSQILGSTEASASTCEKTSECENGDTLLSWMMKADPCNDWGCVFSVGAEGRPRSRRYFMAPNEIMRAMWLESLYRSTGNGLRNVESTSQAMLSFQRYSDAVATGVEVACDSMKQQSSGNRATLMPCRASTVRELGLKLLFLCAKQRLNIAYSETIRQTTEVCTKFDKTLTRLLRHMRNGKQVRLRGSSRPWGVEYPGVEVSRASFGILGGVLADSLTDLAAVCHYQEWFAHSHPPTILRSLAFSSVTQVHSIWLEHERNFPYGSYFAGPHSSSPEEKPSTPEVDGNVQKIEEEELRKIWYNILCSSSRLQRESAPTNSTVESSRITRLISSWLSISFAATLHFNSRKTGPLESIISQLRSGQVAELHQQVYKLVFSPMPIEPISPGDKCNTESLSFPFECSQDTSLVQIVKDLQRDSVRLDGRLLKGTSPSAAEQITRPEHLLALLSSRVWDVSQRRKILFQEANSVGFVRRLFQECSRTVVSGDAYDAACRFFTQGQDIVLVPASADAEPLSFDVIDPYEEASILQEAEQSLSDETCALVAAQAHWWHERGFRPACANRIRRRDLRDLVPPFHNVTDIFRNNPAMREKLSQHRRRRILWADQYMFSQSRTTGAGCNSWWKSISEETHGLLVVFQCFSTFRMIDTNDEKGDACDTVVVRTTKKFFPGAHGELLLFSPPELSMIHVSSNSVEGMLKMNSEVPHYDFLVCGTSAEALFLAEHEFSIRDGSVKMWMPPPTSAQMTMFSKLKRVTHEGDPAVSQQLSEGEATQQSDDEGEECLEEEGTFSPMSFRGRLFSAERKS